MLSFEAPHVDGPVPAPGRVIELVESRGRQLDITWDDGLILHTNLFFGGAWHLYRNGERWRKPMSQMRVGINVDAFTAVCFGARIVETYREFDTHRHPGFGRSGPDLCVESPDIATAVDSLCRYDDLEAPIAEALLDQQVACGVGNVYRSEILWACRQHPMAPVSMLARSDLERVVGTAATILRANLNPVHQSRHRRRTLASRGVRPERSAVPAMWRHDRSPANRRARPVALLVPGCQVRRGPRPATDSSDERPMDPHPAAAKFLAELPWRRRDTLAG